jgi:dolichyl-phosphate beta-glucosyltransferase
MSAKSSHRLSVVVPAFNEEQRLKNTLPHLIKDVNRRFLDYEIIVVDDGSSDQTASIVKEAITGNANVRLIRYRHNMGKGHAVRTGVLAARKDYILFCDADLSTPFREVGKLIKAIDAGSDIAIGSRARKETRILKRQPLYRVLMGKTFNKLVRLLAVSGINDTQCGFKCFKAAIAIDIFRDCQINGFSFDVEMLHVARKRGFSIKEVGVLWKNDTQSKVHPVYHSFQMLKDLLVIRGFEVLGYYGRGEGLRKRTQASSS